VINFRRGLRRLFLAATISWYVLGAGALLYCWHDHFDRVSQQKKSLAQCRASVPSDVNGNPISSGPPIVWDNYGVITNQPPAGYVPQKLDCDRPWPPVNATDEWALSASIVIVPWIVYGAAKVLGWIAQGFRAETGTRSI
jgi:hypothetical protein